MSEVTISQGGRLTARDLDARQGYIGMHDVRYGGESNLSMNLTPEQSCEVAAAILGIDVDELISLASRKKAVARDRAQALTRLDGRR